jgi:hypothetical protein
MLPSTWQKYASVSNAMLALLLCYVNCFVVLS